MSAINLMEWILVIVGILFIIIMILIIITMVANVVTFEKKETVEEVVEKKKKEPYLVRLTYNESVPNGRFMEKLIYIKAVSPEEALKQAEEYFLNKYLSPALRTSYKRSEYITITESIENCVSIN